jgi:hypothetical protein
MNKVATYHDIDLHWEIGDSEARDGYGGCTLLLGWMTMGNVPPKHISTLMLTQGILWSRKSESEKWLNYVSWRQILP